MMNKVAKLSLVAAIAMMGLATVAQADIIAGWDQNSNANPDHPSGFGYYATDFPQANDHGSASATHDLANFDSTVDGNNVLQFVQSFSGTTNNDLALAGAGGSFSFQGGQDLGGVGTGPWSNNGAQSVFAVPTSGYKDILVSWSQRGTATGFTSRVFEYSSDGGANWTNVGAYNHTDATPASAGVLTSTFKTVQLDLSAVSALDNNAGAMFRITYNGATSATGNNRWDNFYVEGTVVPEPSSLILLGIAAFGLCGLARRK
jgi:hypothetical protein